MAGRVSLEPAYVLHRRAYRETSLLLELFSAAHGRVTAVARGARRQASPMRGACEPFRQVLASWSGRGEVVTLTAVEPTDPLPQRVLARHLASAFYLNELLVRTLAPGEAQPEFFEVYAATLPHLGREAPIEAVLRAYEIRLLAALGYGLMLRTEAGGERGIEPSGQYVYVLGEGPRRAEPGSPAAVGPPVSGATLLALAAGEPVEDARVLREAKHLMRHALAPLLGPRPLYSRTLARQARPPGR